MSTANASASDTAQSTTASTSSFTAPAATTVPTPQTISTISAASDNARHEELPPLIDDGIHNNFGEWQLKTNLLFRTWDLWKCIEGPDSNPPIIPEYREPRSTTGPDKDGIARTIYFEGNADEYRQKVEESKPWAKDNALALSKILKAIPMRQLRYVKDTPYAKEAWRTLREIYLPCNSIRIDSIKSDIMGHRCTPDMDVALWLNEMQKFYDILCSMSETSLSDRDFTSAILNNMPKTESWRVIVASYRSTIQQYERDGIPIKSSEFISKIRDENWFYNKDNPQSSAYVFTTRADANKKGPKRTRAPETSGPRSPKKPRTDKTCANCSKVGHEIADCIAYGGGNVGNYPSWWKSPWNIHLAPEKRSKDNNVPPPTHPQFARYAAIVKTATCLTSPPSYAPAEDNQDHVNLVLQGETPSQSLQIWNTQVETDCLVANLPILTTGTPKDDACHYDSGANRHVFHDQTAFQNYRKINPLTVRGFGRNLTATAVGCGNVYLEGNHRGSKSPILLTQVLHIPAAHSNLVSGPLLDDVGVMALLGKGAVVLSVDDVIMVSGTKLNGMYRLDIRIIRPATPQLPQQRDLLSRIAPAASIAELEQGDFHTA